MSDEQMDTFRSAIDWAGAIRGHSEAVESQPHPGGSSRGAVAAVASGIAPLAQAGGSGGPIGSRLRATTSLDSNPVETGFQPRSTQSSASKRTVSCRARWPTLRRCSTSSGNPTSPGGTTLHCKADPPPSSPSNPSAACGPGCRRVPVLSIENDPEVLAVHMAIAGLTSNLGHKVVPIKATGQSTDLAPDLAVCRARTLQVGDLGELPGYRGCALRTRARGGRGCHGSRSEHLAAPPRWPDRASPPSRYRYPASRGRRARLSPPTRPPSCSWPAGRSAWTRLAAVAARAIRDASGATVLCGRCTEGLVSSPRSDRDDAGPCPRRHHPLRRDRSKVTTRHGAR